MNKKSGLTLIEILIAIIASVGLIFTIIAVMTQSTSSLMVGQSNISNLYEVGKIVTNLRIDLDDALKIFPPYYKKGNKNNTSIEFTKINEEDLTKPLNVKWEYDEDKKNVIRYCNGRKSVYGSGKIDDFDIRVMLFPKCNSLKYAEKVSIKLIIKLNSNNKRIESGHKVNICHVITPNNLNLFLQSNSNFKK